MNRKENSFWKQKREFIILGSMIVLSFLCMRLDKSPSALWIKSQARIVSGFLYNGLSVIPRLFDIQKQNRVLLKQVGNYELERMKYREAIFENERLRALLNFKNALPYRCIAAEVIGFNPNNLEGHVHLNIGSQSGCQKNQALINDRGLVGKILSVNRTTSVGQLITDPNFRVSAKVQRTSVLGIVRWLYGNTCLLESISPRGDIQVGDAVVTSGYSEIYPPGLPIGTVVSIEETADRLFKKIIIRTAVDFGQVGSILVLRANLDEE